MTTEQNESDTTAIQVERIPAPALPAEGAIAAAPRTGTAGGLDDDGDSSQEQGAAPPPPPPRRPPRRRPQSVPADSATLPSGSPAPCQQPVQPAPTPIADAATQSLIAQVANHSRAAGQEFLLVVLFDDQWPTCERFATVEGLVSRIKELIGQDVCLFPFLGAQLGITEGVNKFLTTPFGNIPLFDIPDPSEAGTATFGWVGDPLDDPEAAEQESEEAELEAVVDDEEEGPPGSEQAALPVPPPPPPAATSGEDTPMFGS